MNGKIAWITGATAGFGAATVERFVAGGWRVIASGRRAERLQQRAQATHQKGGADQIDGQVDGQIQCFGDEKDRGDRHGRHHEHMLQPEEQQLRKWQYGIYAGFDCVRHGVFALQKEYPNRFG